MAAGSSIHPLDVKYKIKRPSYNVNDLEMLEQKVLNLYEENKHWCQHWLEQSVLIRFLKAFLTVDETLKALQLYCEWKVNYGVDQINLDDEAIQKEHTIGRQQLIEGVTDVCGRPVVIVYPRLHDSYHNNYESLYKYIIFMLEMLCGECDRTSSDGTFCLIFDLKGFAMRNMDYQCVKKIVWFLKNCYPERLGVCLIINYPWIFYGCWEIIKRWLNDVTRSKIQFCGENELRDFLNYDEFPIKLLSS